MLRGGDLILLAISFYGIKVENIHVVSDTGGSEELSRALLGLPDTEELDKQVVRETAVQHLADQEDVGGQSRLQHDGHVGGVEKANGV
jgi:hypothetical protein